MFIPLHEGDTLTRRDGETGEVVETLLITKVRDGNVYCVDLEDDQLHEGILVGENFDDDDIFELNGSPL